jgi:hypothetical protein
MRQVYALLGLVKLKLDKPLPDPTTNPMTHPPRLAAGSTQRAPTARTFP